MKWTLIVPTALFLSVLSGLGDKRSEYIVNGETLVTAIILFYGMWLIGYLSGKNEE
jgi:hypothetical protein